MTQRATPPVAPRACGAAPTPATTTAIATTTPPPPLSSSSSSSSSCASRRRAATVQYVTDKGDAFAVHIFAPHTTATTNTTTASADAMAALLCREAAQTTLPVLFCVHGAGMSGDNFTRLADHLHGVADNNSNNNNNVDDDDERVCAVRAAGDAVPPVDMYVVAYDMRCHGASTHAGGGEAALTLRVLVDDCVAVLRYTLCTLFPRSDCYALGHSLGGAVVVQALSCGSSNTNNSSSDVGKRADVCGSEEAVACMRALRARVCGVVMLDVVEGTARQSLRCMRAFLQKRPDTFASVQDACAWFLQCGGMRSADGAAVSVPPLLQRCDDDNDNNTNNDNDDDDGKVATSRRERWVWRTNLHAMHAVWDGWFVGLDRAFVQLTCPRMLCLANVERLDTALTIAQMRGQFQLEIVGGNCGHYIMDDAPAVLAQKLQRFVWRVANMQRLLQEKLRRAPPPPSLA